MMATAVPSPHAPGRLGQAIPSDQLLAFLDDLRRWRDGRRAELDQLDGAALAAAEPDLYTGDLTLALSVWQAISDRYDQMAVVWDSGRVLAPGRERLSQLIWGRLSDGPGVRGPNAGPGLRGPNAGPGGLAVSLVEALVLSDALTERLRDRLDLDPRAGAGERLTAVRAAVERCRDLATDRASGDRGALLAVQGLRDRVDDLAARADRGADVAGPLGALEADVARAERDLIVAAARQRDLLRDRDRAAATIGVLAARGEAARALAARCTDRIAGAPRLAVPDATRLGAVPETQPELDAFERDLDRVARALDRVEQAYQAPLAERDELRGRLRGYEAMARSTLRADHPLVAAGYESARTLLWSAPCDLAAARAAVTRYQHLVRGDPETPPEEHHG
jgi:hypothetical protein